MTSLSKTEIVSTNDAFARYRFMALRRADEILQGGADAHDDAPAPVTELAAMLMASLEELKVAEEELRERNTVLVARRDAEEALTRHYRQLFLEAPVAAVITDLFGTIHEANLDAGRLFKRDPQLLQRKPLAALIANEHRELFRREFARLSPETGVRDWRVVVNRVGDTPMEVRGTVKLVRGLGPTASGVLYWTFSAPSSDAGLAR